MLALYESHVLPLMGIIANPYKGANINCRGTHPRCVWVCVCRDLEQYITATGYRIYWSIRYV